MKQRDRDRKTERDRKRQSDKDRKTERDFRQRQRKNRGREGGREGSYLAVLPLKLIQVQPGFSA